MGAGYTGDCTEVTSYTTDTSQFANNGHSYCAFFLLRDGSDVVVKTTTEVNNSTVTFTGTTISARANVPATVPAIPLFGLLSLGGLLGLVGVRKLKA